MTAPIYAWRDAITRYAAAGPVLNGLATARAWRALSSTGDGGDAARNGAGAANGRIGAGYARGRQIVRSARVAGSRAAIKRGFPLMVAGLNRAGLGPVNADISRTELRRSGLRAMGEVAARLDLGDAYVVFGHTHRAGPFPDDPHAEWRGRAGARLVNSGSWVYDGIFLTSTPGESPYWPGTCVLVEDTGPPVLKRLLLDRSHAELASPSFRPRPA